MGDRLSYEFTDTGLRQALDALGTTARAVAGNLEALGFSGRVNEPDCCPVANYLRTSLRGATAACVGKDEDLRLYAQVEDGRRARVDAPVVPTAVAEFVRQFDSKLWPDLIEERWHVA